MATTTLEAALEIAAASHAPVERPYMKPVTKAENADARADLDARARAGKTHMTRNNKGRFSGSVKVFTVGKVAAAPVVAKVEEVAVVRTARVAREPLSPAQAPAYAIAAE